MKTYHYILSGRVQGVAFRFYAERMAEQCGVRGSVRNLMNGDVEVFAQGEEAAIRSFEEFLHRGPRLARVEQLKKEIIDQGYEFSRFDVVD